MHDCEAFLAAGASILGVGSALIGLDTCECKEYFRALERSDKDAAVIRRRREKAEGLMELVEMTISRKVVVNENLALIDFASAAPLKSYQPGQFLELWVPVRCARSTRRGP